MGIRYEVKNEGAIITINRPEQRNAINYEVMEELSEVISNAETDPAVKYIVITGSGDRAFCSGGDLEVFRDLRTEDQAYPMLRKMGSVLEQLFFCNKPTIALINGHALGGGSELAIACDYRIARSGVQVGFIQGSIGLTTGWGGSVYALLRMNPTQALQMLMSADRYSAEQAFSQGYLTYVTATKNWEVVAQDFIRDLFKRPAKILSSYKTYWLTSLNEVDIRDRVDSEIRNCANLWASDEHHRAVDAFLSRKNR
ncbi:enoyl-CoA hydratase/isomerase family protein [Pseudalkalibacillus hwajinpoensis]|uniref:enoyl-CoA hydratase/isomerase family protein n=1 Tax=Guptibacillus hwajinpoensis TaxID=208199 RepID=UPI00325C333D